LAFRQGQPSHPAGVGHRCRFPGILGTRNIRLTSRLRDGGSLGKNLERQGALGSYCYDGRTLADVSPNGDQTVNNSASDTGRAETYRSADIPKPIDQLRHVSHAHAKSGQKRLRERVTVQ
jgi:hypothetical protein